MSRSASERRIPALVGVAAFSVGCGGPVSLGDATGLEGGAPDAALRASSISGSPDGIHSFSIVSDAWWVEYPDPLVTNGPVVSTVIYLFSKPLSCDRLKVKKWDENNELGDTQNLEIEIAWNGTTPPIAPPSTSYPAVPLSTGSVPPPGTAGVFYQLTPPMPPGMPSELPAAGGAVVLTGFNANIDVIGTFDIRFSGGNALAGSFDAPYCPGGQEP